MGKGRAASRKVRVYVFREWLLQTYGSYLVREMALGDDGDRNSNGNESGNGSGNDNDDEPRLAPEDSSAKAMRQSNPIPNRKGKRKRSRSCPGNPIVLDVAGGKGDLSWLLENVDGLESIVMDPWKADPNTMSRNERMVKSIEYLRTHPEEAKTRSVPCLPTFQPLAGLLPRLLEERTKRMRLKNKQIRETHHQRSLCGDEKDSPSPPLSTTLTASSCDSDTPCRPEDFVSPRILHVPLDEAMVQKVRMRMADDDASHKEKLEQDAPEECTDKVTDDDEAKMALDLLTSGRIKLIVGFHPDQATEPCIDLARVLGIPYCVVPCCVFPSEFPNRRVRVRLPPSPREPNSSNTTTTTTTAITPSSSGQEQENEGTLVPVRTYQQFLEYLKVKATAPILETSCSRRSSRDEDRLCTIHTSYLDFPFTETAKNIVLYTLPPPQPSNARSESWTST